MCMCVCVCVCACVCVCVRYVDVGELRCRPASLCEVSDRITVI